MQNKPVLFLKRNFILIVIMIVLVILFFSNYNNELFFKMKFYDILTLLILSMVSYYFVEKNSDRRILNSKIEEIMQSIRIEMDKINETLFCVDFEIKNYTIITKKINNKISLLEHFKNRGNFANEVDYIKSSMQELDDMISNHIEDVEELKKFMKDIENKKVLIDKRFDDILKKIY